MILITLKIIMLFATMIIATVITLKEEEFTFSSFIWYLSAICWLLMSGTIDALLGQAKYELITNSDNTRTWEKIRK